MNQPSGGPKQWRKLASDLREFARDVRNPDAKAELLQAAADWDQRAADAEAGRVEPAMASAG